MKEQINLLVEITYCAERKVRVCLAIAKLLKISLHLCKWRFSEFHGILESKKTWNFRVYVAGVAIVS